MTTRPTTEQQPFTEVLARHDKGQLNQELTTAMHELVAAVHARGKAGTLTLKLSIKPIKDVPGDPVVVTSTVTTSAPRRPQQSTWFADSHGELHTSDPTQMTVQEEFTRLDQEKAATAPTTEETPTA